MQYPSEESGYLAGVVAALTTKSNTISTVGGIKIPPVDNWIAGFQAGGEGDEAGRQDVERVLERLQRRGEVQGDRARPDPERLRRRVPGRGRLRPRRTRRGLRAERDRDRRRRRPGGAGRLRAHERAQAAHRSPCSASSTTSPTTSSKAERTSSSASRICRTRSCWHRSRRRASQEIQDAVAEAEAGLKDGSIDPPATLELGSIRTGGGQLVRPLTMAPHG